MAAIVEALSLRKEYGTLVAARDAVLLAGPNVAIAHLVDPEGLDLIAAVFLAKHAILLGLMYLFIGRRSNALAKMAAAIT